MSAASSQVEHFDEPSCSRRRRFDPGADFWLTHHGRLLARAQQRIEVIMMGHRNAADWVNFTSASTHLP